MNLHILHPPKQKVSGPPNFKAALRSFDPDQTVQCKKFGRLQLRPISPDDEVSLIRFHETLSEESIYLRYFEHISLDTRTLHERLTRVCTNTPDSFAIVAVRQSEGEQVEDIFAVGRLTTTEVVGVASFAMLMGEAVQETKLPGVMLELLTNTARAYGFQSLTSELLVADHDALNLCRAADFTLHTIPEDGIVNVTRLL